MSAVLAAQSISEQVAENVVLATRARRDADQAFFEGDFQTAIAYIDLADHFLSLATSQLLQQAGATIH